MSGLIRWKWRDLMSLSSSAESLGILMARLTDGLMSRREWRGENRQAPTRSDANGISPAWEAFLPGQVALVGAGPGDPDLMTLKAWRMLNAADAVVYDRLVGDEILAQLPVHCERYYVGKACGNHSVPQDEIGALMVRLAGEGMRVVRLKGGDPGVFGRMGEELAALDDAAITRHIVPGITAASGAAAALGMPLTDRAHAQRLRFVTAQLCSKSEQPEWQQLARRDETLLFYMGLNRLEVICDELQRHGLPADWPMMLVANASLPEQQTLHGSLGNMVSRLAEHPLPTPCLIIVGSVCQMAAGRESALADTVAHAAAHMSCREVFEEAC
ncbi:uroporphyrinogen-III C-methyltransferase [Cobetia sp. D5]|uniref:uroporphyrinogen-III C-methyltransferase n=1 Tax=Cobetia sp. D5 TaxID=3105867 RepID=UPI002D784AA7|nr:uroporphyrinogen-III C-methyltransferase [Cobetia sp. D5]